ncbi:MAG: hypothetical protein GXP59_03520 [Deltaproteobacteria bacterium]|nr:hypothetical protein [Deltaproteobacteria bacterium]
MIQAHSHITAPNRQLMNGTRMRAMRMSQAEILRMVMAASAKHDVVHDCLY